MHRLIAVVERNLSQCLRHPFVGLMVFPLSGMRRELLPPTILHCSNAFSALYVHDWYPDYFISFSCFNYEFM